MAKTKKTKRPYGEGSIRNRGSKTHPRYYIGWHPRPGAPQVWRTAGDDYGAARAQLREIITALESGTDKYERFRFDKAAEEWFTSYKAAGLVSPKTLDLARTILDAHLLPAFSDSETGLSDYLYQLDYDAIESYRTAKLTGKDMPVSAHATQGRALAPSTVNHHLTVLSQIFTFCQRKNMVSSNPVDIVPRAKLEEPDVEPLTQDEVKSLLHSRCFPDPNYKLLTEVLVRLGLRIGEATALKIEDLEKGQILYVHRTAKRRGSELYSGETKTRAGKRRLKLSDNLYKKLRTHIGTATSGLIFANEYGNLINPSNFRNRQFDYALRQANLKVKTPPVTPHTLRHTFASEKIAAGVPLVQLSYQLGHANVAITQKVYLHILEKHKAVQADLEIYEVG